MWLVAVSCESSGYERGIEFLDELSNYDILKMIPTLWS